MNVVNTDNLRWTTETEYRDLVAEVFMPDINRLRISLYEESFVGIYGIYTNREENR